MLLCGQVAAKQERKFDASWKIQGMPFIVRTLMLSSRPNRPFPEKKTRCYTYEPRFQIKPPDGFDLASDDLANPLAATSTSVCDDVAGDRLGEDGERIPAGANPHEGASEGKDATMSHDRVYLCVKARTRRVKEDRVLTFPAYEASSVFVWSSRVSPAARASVDRCAQVFKGFEP